MMKRKKSPLETISVEDPHAKGKVALVLEVLSGEKTVAGACRETGLKPLQYYKMEGKMVEAMVEAAKLPEGRRNRQNPLETMGVLAEETEHLRREHRRMKCLMRISRKLLKVRARRPRTAIPREKPPTEPVVPIVETLNGKEESPCRRKTE